MVIGYGCWFEHVMMWECSVFNVVEEVQEEAWLLVRWCDHRIAAKARFACWWVFTDLKRIAFGTVLFWGLWKSVKTFHSSRVSKVNVFDKSTWVSATFDKGIMLVMQWDFWKCMNMILIGAWMRNTCWNAMLI